MGAGLNPLQKRHSYEFLPLSFMDWLLTMHLMTATKKGFSAMEVQRQLGRKKNEPGCKKMQKIRVDMSDQDDKYVPYGTLEMGDRCFENVTSEYQGSPKRPVKRGRGSGRQAPVLVRA